MKKLYILSMSVFMLTSCIKDDLNVDKKNPSSVPAGTLFSNAQKNLTDVMTSTSVNRNVFRLITQQWTETTYTDESNYDLATRNIPQTFWNIMYRDVLKNLEESKKIVEADNTIYTDPIAKKNKLAEIELMEAYTYSVLVNSFGNIPYTEALDPNNPHPKYDDAKTITLSLVSRINAALATLSAGDSFGSGDLLYGGDIAKWTKFGNSLKLKIGMMLADVDAASAKTIVESTKGKVFTSNDDNAAFHYLDAPPNTNPLWVDLVASGRYDFVAASTIVDQMNALSDPRRTAYFTIAPKIPATSTSPEIPAGYRGGTPGASSNYDSFSHAGALLNKPNFEALLLDYSEVEFLLAEAKERNMDIGTGTAVAHYANGIQASLDYWGTTSSDVTAYVANATAAYSNPLNTKSFREKIGVQKAIALYNRGYDAWTEWRRLDFPKLSPAVDAVSGIPVRLSYPVQEQNLNTAKYTEASAAIGGDKVETRLFWDTKAQ